MIAYRVCTLVLVAIAAIVPVARSASACTMISPEPLPGVLSGHGGEDGEVPRSVAFYPSSRAPRAVDDEDIWLPVRLADGKLVPATAVLRVSDAVYGRAIVKPIELLPANANIEVYSWPDDYSERLVTNEDIDDVPPLPPKISGGSLQQHNGETACSNDSCGDYTFMTLDIAAPGSDNMTPASMLVYVLFLGSTAEEAAGKADADRLQAIDSPFDETFFEILEDSSWDRDVFVSVAAVDQSGNISKRTKPIQIHSNDEGCIMSRRPRRLDGAHLLIGLLSLLGLSRRYQSGKRQLRG
jgi:hypothetical protein